MSRPDEPGEPPAPDEDRDSVRSLVLHQEIADLRAARDDAMRRERRHWAVAVFGVSPSVVAVFLGLLYMGSFLLVVVFSVLVLIVEGWRASHAGREASELAARLEELRAELEEGDRPG